LLPDSQHRPIKLEHNDTMLKNAEVGLHGIMEEMSRLPHQYVEKHSDHISKTMVFVGYLLSQVQHKIKEPPTLSKGKPTDDLKKLAEELEHFDIYFLANVNTGDGQEKWFRRLVWRHLSQKEAESVADKVLKHHHIEVKK